MNILAHLGEVGALSVAIWMGFMAGYVIGSKRSLIYAYVGAIGWVVMLFINLITLFIKF